MHFTGDGSQDTLQNEHHPCILPQERGALNANPLPQPFSSPQKPPSSSLTLLP